MTENSTILIVDDEYLIGLALADELQLRGLGIAGPYVTSKMAEENFADDAPDFAFLDVNLGKGRTSHDFALSLIEKGIPVVFLTGYSEMRPSDARFDDVPILSKPVDIQMALNAIEAGLKA